MRQDKKVYQCDLAGRTVRVEIGELASQANGAALIYYGDTAVLSTATASKQPTESPFFPLTVTFEEKAYAVGKIPGGFTRREGRPDEGATLSARLIDRSIRPLFPAAFHHEVITGNMVLSLDMDCKPQLAAMLGTSLALSLSDIPFTGPVAAVMIGRVDGHFVVNPTVEQDKRSDLHLTVAGTKAAINMVEAGADQLPEALILDALMFAHEEIKKLIAFQEQIIHENCCEKMNVRKPDEGLKQRIQRMMGARLGRAVRVKEKQARDAAIDDVRTAVTEELSEKQDAPGFDPAAVTEVLDILLKEEVRRMIVCDHLRPDGRAVDEIRPLSARAALLPRAHGSGLFTRGQTQVLSVCTLAPFSEAQEPDCFDAGGVKRFLHHYNFPGFSTGEVRVSRSPGRREIGHGALGERALLPVLPDEARFPYMIRCVSEVLESNGSSSQASICAATLALMDAGVPIKAPVAGIAMGLVTYENDPVILTDIQGMEDACGDMDFKCAGTVKGVTALQMDIKISGVTWDIVRQALQRARAGRLHILETMLSTLAAPRDRLSDFAPKVIRMTIRPEKIRDVIGAGGRTINKIIAQTGVKIDIKQSGILTIFSADTNRGEEAKQIIEDLIRDVHAGEIFLGRVERIEKFGVIVSLFGHRTGLLHISEIDMDRTMHIEDFAHVGDEIRVKVIEADHQGRIRLSQKALIEQQEAPVQQGDGVTAPAER